MDIPAEPNSVSYDTSMIDKIPYIVKKNNGLLPDSCYYDERYDRYDRYEEMKVFGKRTIAVYGSCEVDSLSPLPFKTQPKIHSVFSTCPQCNHSNKNTTIDHSHTSSQELDQSL